MTTDSRIKVVVIGPLPAPLNGMTVMTAHALEAIRQSDIPMVHCDTSDHRRAGNVGRLDPVNVVLALAHAWKVFATIGRVRPAVVYLPIAQETLGFLRDSLFFLSAYVWRTKTVVHFHGAELGRFYARSGWAVRWILRQCLMKVSRAIVLTEELAGEFDAFLPRSRVSIVHNGIPSAASTRLQTRERVRPRVLFLSNLNPRKGMVDVLHAAQVVVKAIPEVEFVVAGEWPSESAYAEAKALVEQLGVGRSITFLAATSGLRKTQLLRSSDVFVFPPRRPEGQSLVVLEAMSAGVPVVTTALGGLRDTIIDGVTGVVVDAEAPTELGKAIVKLLLDSNRRASISHASITAFNDRWQFEMFAENLIGVLRAVMEAPEVPCERVVA